MPNPRTLLARGALSSGAVLLAAVAFLGYEYTRYLPAGEVDSKPYPLKRIELEPPPSDGPAYYGKLRLAVYIDAHGKVDRVAVVGAGVPGRLRDGAVKAFEQSRWEPARKWGVAVKSVKEVEVEFEPPPLAHQPLARPPAP
ncbi:MAG: energy transducer TonB [Usitatibacter sp.]